MKAFDVTWSVEGNEDAEVIRIMIDLNKQIWKDSFREAYYDGQIYLLNDEAGYGSEESETLLHITIHPHVNPLYDMTVGMLLGHDIARVVQREDAPDDATKAERAEYELARANYKISIDDAQRIVDRIAAGSVLLV